MFSFVTPKFLMAFAAGIVVGALGYKLCADKNFNPQAVQKTVLDLADKLKTTRGRGGRGHGPEGAGHGPDGEGRGGHGPEGEGRGGPGTESCGPAGGPANN